MSVWHFFSGNTVVGCYAITPAKVSIMQFVLSFLCSVSDAVSGKQHNAAYIFAIFVVIVEVEAKINSCMSHLKDRNLKIYMHQNRKTCVQIELVYNVISWFTRLHVVSTPTFEGSLSKILYI